MATSDVSIKSFRSPKTVIGQFVARHTMRGAVLWAAVFGGYVASKAIGFVDLYPTTADRLKIAHSFGSNVGVELLLGRAPRVATTAAYAAWNTGNIMVVIGSIWALLLATKYFRGEEASGRFEVFLAGQTTARRAALNILSGIGISLAGFYAVLAGLLVLVGRYHGVDFGVSAALFFALCVTLGIGVFLSIGAFLSQLMPTRSKAAGITAGLLGASFLLKVIGDITSAHWVLHITPLGWEEQLQPLAGSRTIWLVPLIALITVLIGATFYVVGRRDFNESIIADKPVSKTHLNLLQSPFGSAFRLNRMNALGWLSGVTISAVLYGLITKSTAQVFSQSASFEKAISRLAQQTRLSSALAFLGIVFFMQMVLIMVYAASTLAALRRDEADGYIDNFLVQPYSRLRWLTGRLVMIGLMVLAAGSLTTVGIWLSLTNQNLGVPFHALLLAGINMLAPAILTIGVGIFTFGIYPRLTSFMAYGVLAWSFLIQTLSSGLNLNHWLLDTSVLHQIVFAPAVSPNWGVDLMVVALSFVLILCGALLFNNRDLAVE